MKKNMVKSNWTKLMRCLFDGSEFISIYPNHEFEECYAK